MKPAVRARLARLALAEQCLALGASLMTVRRLTGMSRYQCEACGLRSRSAPKPRRFGRPPEWYFEVGLIHKVEASLVVSIYGTVHGSGEAAALLAGAYRCYRLLCGGPPRISFDRAALLVGHVFGLWELGAPGGLALRHCRDCARQSLTSLPCAYITGPECVWCKLCQRYALDARIRRHFPAPRRAAGAAFAEARTRAPQLLPLC